jgi:hypothetical protein
MRREGGGGGDLLGVIAGAAKGDSSRPRLAGPTLRWSLSRCERAKSGGWKRGGRDYRPTRTTNALLAAQAAHLGNAGALTLSCVITR